MEELIQLYRHFKGSFPEEIIPLPPSASARKYFRLTSGTGSVIGTYSPDIRETRAFSSFSRHFKQLGIRVPELYAVSRDEKFYLQQDLGDELLYDRLKTHNFNIPDHPELMVLYKKALEELAKIQIVGGKGLDYSLCVPRGRFDMQSVIWDLNHFKYYFLKLSGIPFDEDKLETDFQTLAHFLSEKPMEHFMFRDFQSRNIIIFQNSVYLVDYQGGRKGPLQYDLASLLFEAKTSIPEDVRQELMDEYLRIVSEHTDINRREFRSDFYWWSLVRLLQALGAYGIRGKIEKKALFLQSIPSGLENLGLIMKRIRGGPDIRELRRCIDLLVSSASLYPREPGPWEGLTVTITSFSYRNSYPDDLSGNGGGFVYDCRHISNPGRYEKYRDLTGFDSEVEEFFRDHEDMEPFLEDVKSQILKVVIAYREMNYRHLSVNFGCTGGKHRSVYASRKICEFLRQLKDVKVIENHRELNTIR